jgi:hypothetical protein
LARTVPAPAHARPALPHRFCKRLAHLSLCVPVRPAARRQRSGIWQE